MTIKKIEDLEIWHLARRQAKEVFVLTQMLPLVNDLDLLNQINRASGSVMDNIAEGFGRGGNKEFKHFLSIARGSNSEVRSQLHRASDKQYISSEVLKIQLTLNADISVKVTNFITYLTKSEYSGPKFKQ